MPSNDLNLFTSATFAKNNKKLVKDFIQASNMGWQYALENPEQIIDVILKKYNSQNKSLSALLYEAYATEKLVLEHLYPIGIIEKSQIKDISESLLANKNIEKIRLLNNLFIDGNQQAPGVDPELFKLFTNKEQQYLKEHPVLSVQGQKNAVPFNFVHNGKTIGYSIDYLKTIGAFIGVDFEFIQGFSWSQSMEMLKNGQLDLMTNIILTEQRAQSFSFSPSFVSTYVAIALRKGDEKRFNTIDKLKHHKIAVIEGYYHNEILQKRYPSIDIIEVKDTLSGLEMVSSNRVDAYIEDLPIIQYFIGKYLLSNLTPVIITNNEYFPLEGSRLATNKSNQLLLSILKKSVEYFPESKQMELKNKWFANTRKNSDLAFSIEEAVYLKTHPELIIQNQSDSPPFNFNLDGKASGYSIDFMKLISKKLGLKTRFIQGKYWHEYLSMLKENKLDVITNIIKTKDREQFYSFSIPYADISHFAILRRDEQYLLNDQTLAGQRIAVISGYVINEGLKKDFPKASFVEFPTTTLALKGVLAGEADIYFESYAIANYYIQKSFMTGLVLTAIPSSMPIDNYPLRIATNKSNKVLTSILNKAISSIPEAELIQLRKKWFVKSLGRALFQLNTKQKQWLIDNPKIKVYLPPLDLPLGQAVRGEYQGIVADIFNYVQQQLDVQWLPKYDLKKGNSQKDDQDFIFDVTFSNNKASLLQDNYLFSQPIINMPVVVLTAKPGLLYIDDLASLKTMKTGIVIDASYKAPLVKKNQNLYLYEYESMSAAVMGVSSGDVDVLLCPLLHCSYLMNQLGINNVRIVGQTALHESLSIAVRDDWPELLAIINKSLSTMSSQHLNGIYKQWNTREDIIIRTEYQKFWYLMIAAIITISLIFLWNRKIAKYSEKLEIAHQELKGAQQQLLRSEKLASLGTLTAGIAHEINNPTNFIYSAIYLMENEIYEIKAFLKQLAGGDNADKTVITSIDTKFLKLEELRVTASEGANRIKTIVEDLGAFTRIDSGVKSEVKISLVIERTLNLIRTQYSDINVVEQLNVDPHINCYPAKLAQVFMNLLVNACQAIESKKQWPLGESGLLLIKTSQVNSFLKVDICDNGCGMDEISQQKIFDPFYTTKEVGSGTGLGMAISFSIIEEHGGYIEVNSIVNQGSTLSLYLPY